MQYDNLVPTDSNWMYESRASLAIEAMECLYSLFGYLPDLIENTSIETVNEEGKQKPLSATTPEMAEQECRACIFFLPLPHIVQRAKISS